MLALRKGSALTVRYLVKYTKEGEIKFISHLDLMRTIQRVIRRAKLPIEYSKGFNPHMSLSIAQPLSVGVYSCGEYLDVVFTEELKEEEIIDSLNKHTVGGVKFLNAVKVIVPENKKVPQGMALIDGAKYIIKLKLKEGKTINFDSIKEFPHWNMLKKTKSGEKEVDIRSLVKSIEGTIKDDRLVVETVISCGSRENLSASLLSDFIKSFFEEIDKEAFVDIMRVEMYALKDEELIPLDKFFS